MPERWRSSAARELVAAVRKAGDTRRDLRRDGAAGKITGATGLKL